MKKLSLIFVFVMSGYISAQTPALVGYWQNWHDSQSPWISLTDTDTTYNIIQVSFATIVSGTANMGFTPDGITQQEMISQIQQMQTRGKKVMISIGGQNGAVQLNNAGDLNVFVSSMTTILNTYNFDGVDIDIEGQLNVTQGTTIANPTDTRVVNLISAIKQLMTNYRTNHHKKMMLTMAPECANVQGGIANYITFWGAYLPVIHALRDSLDILHVQLYNAPGGMSGIGGTYYQGTADFIVAMTDAVIRGFDVAGNAGHFEGLPASKVAVGLPACTSAAGTGSFISPDTVKKAINYLLGRGPKPGAYTLPNPHPTLRGMMTWSINWDNTTTCHTTRYEFAKNYHNIFHLGSIGINENNSTIKDYSLNQNYPNPFNPSTLISFEIKKAANVSITLYNNLGIEVSSIVNRFYNAGSYDINFNAENLSAGTYYYQLKAGDYSETRKMILVK